MHGARRRFDHGLHSPAGRRLFLDGLLFCGGGCVAGERAKTASEFLPANSRAGFAQLVCGAAQEYAESSPEFSLGNSRAGFAGLAAETAGERAKTASEFLPANSRAGFSRSFCKTYACRQLPAALFHELPASCHVRIALRVRTALQALRPFSVQGLGMQTPSFCTTPAYETEGFASRRGSFSRSGCRPPCFPRPYCDKQGVLHERGGPSARPMQTPSFSTILVQQMGRFAFLGPGAQQIEGFAWFRNADPFVSCMLGGVSAGSGSGDPSPAMQTPQLFAGSGPGMQTPDFSAAPAYEMSSFA